ncbi:unnamed protein product [Heterobilharzia americana]|nr:unnamed protein product [Heterobilharzia americana]
MVELKMMRRLSEPITGYYNHYQQQSQYDQSDTSTNQSLSRDVTFNRDEQTRILAMPISLYRRKYLQKYSQWIKGDITIQEDVSYFDDNQRTSIYENDNNNNNNATEMFMQDVKQSQTVDNKYTSSTNYDQHTNCYFLKTNHQVELIQSINRSTNFFFTLASQIQRERQYSQHYQRYQHHHQQQQKLSMNKEEKVRKKKEMNIESKKKLTRNKDMNKKQVKEMESYNHGNNQPINNNTVFNSSSNLLLHCITIDECPQREEFNTDSYSVSPYEQIEDIQTLSGIVTNSEMDKNDTSYECTKTSARKKLDTVSPGVIPKEINRNNFYKHRKYVNKPFKLTMHNRKRPDPFA